jgi:LuxR family maltose regulon positive regulatory protein
LQQNEEAAMTRCACPPGLSGSRAPFGQRAIGPVGREVAASAAAVPAPRPAGDALDYGLSERDVELLRHLKSGLSTGRTAAAMGLSTNTVRTRVRRLQRKLDVEHRDAVIRFAQESVHF